MPNLTDKLSNGMCACMSIIESRRTKSANWGSHCAEAAPCSPLPPGCCRPPPWAVRSRAPVFMSWKGSNCRSCATWHAGSCRSADPGSSDKYMQTDRLEGRALGWFMPHCTGQNVYKIVSWSITQADSFGKPLLPSANWVCGSTSDFGSGQRARCK